MFGANGWQVLSPAIERWRASFIQIQWDSFKALVDANNVYYWMHNMMKSEIPVNGWIDGWIGCLFLLGGRIAGHQTKRGESSCWPSDAIIDDTYTRSHGHGHPFETMWQEHFDALTAYCEQHLPWPVFVRSFVHSFIRSLVRSFSVNILNVRLSPFFHSLPPFWLPINDGLHAWPPTPSAVRSEFPITFNAFASFHTIQFVLRFTFYPSYLLHALINISSSHMLSWKQDKNSNDNKEKKQKLSRIAAMLVA